ncbi:MAG: carbon storage regulator [Gemmatales bacterium]|nr:carbon storage regulator [Gemmatales bacterium]MDW8388259.1 carbon storage regulator [Gemmatales bacterium]
MLVLSRKPGQSIIIDGHIRITITQVRGETVRLGIEAPPEVRIHREEVQKRIEEFHEDQPMVTPASPAGVR